MRGRYQRVLGLEMLLLFGVVFWRGSGALLHLIWCEGCEVDQAGVSGKLGGGSEPSQNPGSLFI